MKDRLSNFDSARFFYLKAIIFLGILMAFFFMAYYTPLYVDDYDFRFIFVNEDVPRYAFLDFPPFSWYMDNFSAVARFVPHLFVAFSGIVNHTVFALFTTLLFGALCLLAARTVTKNTNHTLSLAIIFSVLIIFLVPGFFDACLWKTGVCNYLVTAILVTIVYLLAISRRIANWRSPAKCIGLFLLGFISGWTNEGFVVGLAASLFIYFFIMRRSLLNRGRLWLSVGFFLGVIVLCLSPWNIYRWFSLGHEGAGLMSNLVRLANSVIDSWQLIITCCVIVLLVVIGHIRGRSYIRNFVISESLLIITVVFSILFLYFIGFTLQRAKFPVDFYSLLLLLKLMDSLKQKVISVSASLAGVIGLVLIVSLLPKMRANYLSYEAMAAQIEGRHSLILTHSTKVSGLESRFIVPVDRIYFPFTFLDKKLIGAYYGNPDITILEEPVYRQLCKIGPAWQGYFYEDTGVRFIKLPTNAEISTAIYNLRPYSPDDVPIYLKPLASRLDRFTMNRVNERCFDVIDINGEKWLELPAYPVKEIEQRKETVTVIYTVDGDEPMEVTIPISSFL